ncbi:MAG: DUF1153 domain-containing protein [Patescibacteria group bacterium]
MEKSKPLPTVQDLRGNVITPQDLPPPDTIRWTPNKKAIVIRAGRGGLVGLEEVLERYHMTEREFHLWEDGFNDHGEVGLRVTQYQRRRGRITK